MILRLSSHTESPCLHVWEDNANKLSKGGRVECRDTFITASLCISREDTISAYRM
jgi:hypothetical protein